MKKLDLKSLIESVGKIPERPQFKTIDQNGVNFANIPNIVKLIQQFGKVTPNDFNNLLRNDPNAVDIAMAIRNEQFSLNFNDPVYQMYRNLVGYIHQQQSVGGNNIRVSKLNPIFENAKREFGEFATDIIAFYNYVARLRKYKKDNGLSNKKNTNLLGASNIQANILQIKNFKKLTEYLTNTPEFSDITDDSFKDFLDARNTEAETYYSAMISGDDTLTPSDTPLGRIYQLYKNLRYECNNSIITLSSAKNYMDKIHSYYGVKGDDIMQGTSSNEFHDVKSLPLSGLKEGEKIIFKYQLFDSVKNAYYLNSNYNYEYEFIFHRRTYTYLFVRTDDVNIFFEFAKPIPNPIEVEKIYNIIYSSLTEDRRLLRIKFTELKSKKKSVANNLINCSAIQELTELIKNIKAHSR